MAVHCRSVHDRRGARELAELLKSWHPPRGSSADGRRKVALLWLASLTKPRLQHRLTAPDIRARVVT